MKDLVASLAEARAKHPGLEQRQLYLDKTQWDIEERLAGELRSRNRKDAGEFTRTVLFGAEPLTPPGVVGPTGDRLRVVPPGIVKEAAAVLLSIDPAKLFESASEDWLYEDFKDLQTLYSAAAEHGEAIVVGD
jgi:hypothetical protein